MDPRIRLFPRFPKPDGTSWGWWRTPEGQWIELETRGVIASFPDPVKAEDGE